MTQEYLIEKYLKAVKERDALNEGTLDAEETAGYWLYHASHNPRVEFDNMLKSHGIRVTPHLGYHYEDADPFYETVNNILEDVGI